MTSLWIKPVSSSIDSKKPLWLFAWFTKGFLEGQKRWKIRTSETNFTCYWDVKHFSPFRRSLAALLTRQGSKKEIFIRWNLRQYLLARNDSMYQVICKKNRIKSDHKSWKNLNRKEQKLSIMRQKCSITMHALLKMWISRRKIEKGKYQGKAVTEKRLTRSKRGNLWQPKKHDVKTRHIFRV